MSPQKQMQDMMSGWIGLSDAQRFSLLSYQTQNLAKAAAHKQQIPLAQFLLKLPAEQIFRAIGQDQANALASQKDKSNSHNAKLTMDVAPPQFRTQPSNQSFPQIPNYEITKKLGQGGMGAVYAARNTQLNREVALKVVLGADSNTLSRFDREGKVMALLEHKNIPPIHEKGMYQTEHGKLPYMSMKIVPGSNLEDILLRRETSPLEDSTLRQKRDIQTIVQICNGVYHAHSKGVLHRDLKLENIMISPDRVYVMDWGLAGFVSGATDISLENATSNFQDDQLTVMGDILGTLAYMPPEQAKGKEDRYVDERADVYTIAAMAYELLTGNRFRNFAPEHNGTIPILLAISDNGGLVGFKGYPNGFAPELESILDKGLKQDCNDRHYTVDELRLDFQAYLDSELVPSHNYSILQKTIHFAGKHLGKLAVASTSTVLALSIGAGYLALDAKAEQALRLQQESELKAAKAESDKLEATLDAQSARLQERESLLQQALNNQDWNTAREHLGAIKAYTNLEDKNAASRLETVQKKIDGVAQVCVVTGSNFGYDIDPISGADNPSATQGNQTFELQPGTYLVTGDQNYRDILTVLHGQNITLSIHTGPQINGMTFVAPTQSHKGRLEAKQNVSLNGFYMSTTPVTFRDYFEFTKSAELRRGQLDLQSVLGTNDLNTIRREVVPHLRNDRAGRMVYLQDENTLTRNSMNLDMPVVGITPRGARAYLIWKSLQDNRQYTLAKEEHVRAAWGEESGRRYPWGNTMLTRLLPPLEDRVGSNLGSLIVGVNELPTSDLGVKIPNVQTIITDGTNYFAFGGRYKDLTSEGFSAPFAIRYMSGRITGSDVGFSYVFENR